MKPSSCFWDEKDAKLVGNKAQKVREYLRDDLVRKINLYAYDVLPTKNRHQTHRVLILNDTNCTCTCQAWHINGKDCSHILACKMFQWRQQNDGVPITV